MQGQIQLPLVRLAPRREKNRTHSRAGDAAVLFSFHDFRRCWEVKASFFFVTGRFLKNLPEREAVQFEFKELRSRCGGALLNSICIRRHVYFGHDIYSNLFFVLFPNSSRWKLILVLLKKEKMQTFNFELTTNAQSTGCKRNDFRLRHAVFKTQTLQSRLYSSKSPYVARSLHVLGGSTNSERGENFIRISL